MASRSAESRRKASTHCRPCGLLVWQGRSADKVPRMRERAFGYSPVRRSMDYSRHARLDGLLAVHSPSGAEITGFIGLRRFSFPVQPAVDLE